MSTRRAAWIAALTIAVAACGGGAETGEIELPGAVTSVNVDIGSGSVTIDGDVNVDVPTVQTEASFDSTAPTVDVTLTDGVLSIRHECAQGESCSVDYFVSLPDGTGAVDVTTGEGAVSLSDIDGPVTVTVGDGDVFLNTVTGTIVVTQGTGDVLGARLESPAASFETGKGNIDVTFDTPVEDLTIVTGDGNATAQVTGAPYRLTTVGEGALDVKIATEDGAARSITIEAPGDIRIYER